MKKVLSVIAVSAFVMTAGVAVAGGPGKKKDAACPEACQQQIDDLQSSQAQQNEMLDAHGKQLENHEGRITALEKDAYDPWFVRIGVRAAWANMNVDGIFFNSDTDTDAGFGGALAFGREFGQFRVEGELAYQGADIDTMDNVSVADADYDLTTAMVNGYYELPVYDAFSVYAMAGVGIAKLSVDAPDIALDDSDQAFAYKAGVGMTYNFTEEIAADLGYEYLGVADTDVADSFSGHNVVGSVRFKF